MAAGKFWRNLSEAWWPVIGWVLAGVLAGRVVTAILMLWFPVLYESVARVREDPAPSVPPGAEMKLSPGQREILVRRLDLGTRWQIEDAVAAHRLAEAVWIRRSEDGMGTEMVARTAMARDAADLCDAMAAEYRGWERFQLESVLSPGDLLQILDQPAEEEMFGKLRRQHADWIDRAAGDPALASGMKLVDEGRELPADHPARREDLRAYRILMDLIRSFEQRESIRMAVVERTALPDPGTTDIVAPAKLATQARAPKAKHLASIAQAAGVVAGLGLAILYLAKWRNPKTAAANHQGSESAHQPSEF